MIRYTGWRALALPIAMIVFLVFMLIVGHFWPTAPVRGKFDPLARCQRESPPWDTAQCGPTPRRTPRSHTHQTRSKGHRPMTPHLTPLLVAGICLIAAVAIYAFGYNRGHNRGWTSRVDQYLIDDTCRVCGASNAAGDHHPDCPHHSVYAVLDQSLAREPATADVGREAIPAGVTVTIAGQCDHLWAYAPTVGNYSCVRCGRWVKHGTAEHGAITAALSTPTAAGEVPASNVALGRFGHHPNPAIDFEIEVAEIESITESARIGLTGSKHDTDRAGLARRIELAMLFQVGGDPSACAAKARLRAIADVAPSSEPAIAEGERVAVARAHAKHSGQTSWWWDAAFDDATNETAEHLRNNDLMAADDILAALAQLSTPPASAITPPTTNDAILSAFSPQGLDAKEGGKITQAAVDAALDAEFATDAGGDVPAVGYSYSIREVMEEFGANLSTREIENAMHTALAAALNPPAGNEWAISFDREGPR